MANQKLTALTALAALSADDLFYVVDDPAGAANQRKMAASVLDARYLQVANNLSDLASRQTALDTLTNVAAATNEHVLTKDTATGNAIFKAAPATGAPVGSTYIVQTPDGTLTNEQALSALATGLLKNTTGTGVLSIAAEGADYFNPPFLDTNALVKGSADPTKLLRFEVDGFGAGATRVMTPPNQDTTLAGLSVAQTFTVPQTITIGAGTDIGLVINTAGATPYGMVLAGNSRLGIGTYTPAYIADIQGGTLRIGDSTVDSRLRIEGNQEFMLGMRNGAANDYAWLGATMMGGFQFSNKFGDALVTISQLGGVDLTQLSTTGARPTLKLTQLDLSEELIEFFGTVATGNPIEAVGAKTLTTTHFIRVSVNGSFLYIPVGTIA